jgi:hypothetical protein
MTIRKTCSTGKTRYDTPQKAQDALDRIRAKPANPNNFFDTYRPNYVRSCPKCRGFHLSSNRGKDYGSGKTGRNYRVGRRK